MNPVNKEPPIAMPDRSEPPSIPLYEAVKRQLSEAILLGTWPPGSPMPTEVELARSFGVAVGTVRRALGDLAAEGLIVRRRKHGTVVTGRSPHHSLRFFFQYFRLHGLDGGLLRSTVRMLDVVRAPADSSERKLLQLDREAPVVRLRRVRVVDGRPAMHEWLSLPEALLPDFPEEAAAVPGLLYLHLLERYGIRVAMVREELRAEPACAEDRRIFGPDSPPAVLVIDEIAFDAAGMPVIAALHRARTDHYRYINEVR